MTTGARALARPPAPGADRLAESEFARDEASLEARRLAQHLEDSANGTRAAGFELGVELTALEVKNARLQAELQKSRARISELERELQQAVM